MTRNWQDPQNQTTPTAGSLCPGTYDVYLRDQSGCYVDTHTVTIVEIPEPPALNLGNDTTLCDSTVYVLTPTAGFVTYLWHDNTVSPTYTVDTPGTYSLQGFDSVGCATADTIVITYMPCPTSGIASSGREVFVLFPNPAHDFLQITTNTRIDEISIIGMDGRTHQVIRTTEHVGRYRVDLTNLMPGVYTVLLSASELNWSKRFVVEK